ncbi:MAG: hypothetical protein M3082_12310 [Candidatus Dormibacteraeota bacterium]|nr:hypothetical protein [Candidatus Dormibacteraeota bacterium]
MGTRKDFLKFGRRPRPVLVGLSGPTTAPPTSSTGRTVGACALLLALVLVVTGCGGSPGNGGNAPGSAPTTVDGVPIGLPDVAGGSATGVSLTPQTVVIDRATVAANLRHVSGDGTYTFASAGGALATLAPGKVILLQGTDAAHVTSVDNSGGQLVVHTAPVSIPEVIQSGQFHYKGPIDFRNAIVVPVVDAPAPLASPSATTSSLQLASLGPSTGYPNGPARLNDAFRSKVSASLSSGGGPPGLFVQGPLESRWSYRAGIVGDNNGLNIQATLCLSATIAGTTCSNSSVGLTGSVTVNAHLNFGNANFDMSVLSGQVAQGGYSTSNISGGWKIQYAFGQGDSVRGVVDFPVLRIPYAWDTFLPIGGLPWVVKIRAAVIIKLGLATRNATMEGGVDYSMTGQTGISQTASGVSGAPGTGGAAHGTVLGTNAGNRSVTLAPSGTVVAIQVKFGPGLGISEANAVYYFDVVTSIGQTTGSAIAGMICSYYTIDISLGGNFELSIGNSKIYQIVVTTPRKILWQFPLIYFKEAGCPPIA